MMSAFKSAALIAIVLGGATFAAARASATPLAAGQMAAPGMAAGVQDARWVCPPHRRCVWVGDQRRRNWDNRGRDRDQFRGREHFRDRDRSRDDRDHN